MHGLGNDYVYIDCSKSCPDNLPQLSIDMSRRHVGIGSDGIILILPSDIADFKMRIFNADGSEAKMCGNGSRCVGKYVYDHHLTDKTDITLETLSGVKHLSLTVDTNSNKVEKVQVDMGVPEFQCQKIPVISETETMINAAVDSSIGPLDLTAVSMGNPHGVIFIDKDPRDIPLSEIGPELECHPMWPDRANIEFARVVNPHLIEMRVWERGSGETQACGTGACAVAAAAVKTRRAISPVTVKLVGGDLSIKIDDASGNVLMTGPAVEVFSGSFNINPANKN